MLPPPQRIAAAVAGTGIVLVVQHRERVVITVFLNQRFVFFGVVDANAGAFAAIDRADVRVTSFSS